MSSPFVSFSLKSAPMGVPLTGILGGVGQRNFQ